MPRVSREQSQKNREAIEHASSKLIRERGLGVSVADMMGAAGLTHGGFYGHFQSKDELTAIACALALSEGVERWKKRMAGAKSAVEAREALIEGYLSSRNRDATHCPLATLPIDVTREDANKPVRNAFDEGLEQFVALLSSVQPTGSDSDEQRTGALAQISTMVGALVLARATKGKPISDELLAAARAWLQQP